MKMVRSLTPQCTSPNIPIIKILEFSVSKISAISTPMTINENPDSNDSSNATISKPITQRRCSPALAPVKSAPLRIALVKFAPLISALLKLAPVRSLPLKEHPWRFLPE